MLALALALTLVPVLVLALVPAPPVLPELVLVLVLGKGEDEEDEEEAAGRASTGGKRSLSISDFRLRGDGTTRPEVRWEKERGGRRRNARVIK